MGSLCPVCETELLKTHEHGMKYFYECPLCGPFSLSFEVQHDIAHWLSTKENSRAILSHVLYRMTKREQWAQLTTDLVANILKNTELPRPKQQLDNLILWMGEKQKRLGDEISDTLTAVAATGAGDMASLGFLVNQAIAHGYLHGSVTELLGAPPHVDSLRLTISGWDYYEIIQRTNPASHLAFMAMKFGDAQTDLVYRDHFKIAVVQVGFDLRRLDEGQRAGLIDDRLRVEIRQSRFLIADLTHHNNGAYWEAGYAEGLGKPVIYTCRRDVFNDKSRGTHFDTNHHLTVVWAPDNLADAVEELKATIRATLPEDAKLND
jgi:hypothetical protein